MFYFTASLSAWWELIKSQSDKLLQQNKQNNKTQTTIFQKNDFGAEPKFTKSERKVRCMWTIFKKFSRWAEKDPVKEKVLSFQEDGRKRNMVIKIQNRIYP